MRYLLGEEEKEANKYLYEAAKIAFLGSRCLRARCGSVIVKEKEVIGKGFNSPPRNLESQRRCLALKNELHKKVSDKTCCLHAEQRAIFYALRNNPEKLNDSRLYFVKLDNKGDIERAGSPYCTICSKTALDIGIGEFVLWHDKGICAYNTEEYNILSFQFRE